MSGNNKRCNACKKEESDETNKLKMCSICRNAQYCSVECQQSDWATHKRTCTKSATQQLIDAIDCNDEENVKRLAKTKRVLNGRVDYTPKNEDGEPSTLGKWTALHECVRGEDTSMMKILLDNGANVEIQDVDGETPMFVASTTRNAEIAQLLLSAGANPNATAQDGWSCLMMAARDGDYEVCKALLEAGADMSAGTDMFGRGVLDLVTQMRSGQAIRISHGENPEDARERYEKVYLLLTQHATRHG